MTSMRGIRPLSCLGNFLSGMETPVPGGPKLRVGNLGNFLSGMETDVAD